MKVDPGRPVYSDKTLKRFCSSEVPDDVGEGGEIGLRRKMLRDAEEVVAGNLPQLQLRSKPAGDSVWVEELVQQVTL